MPLEDIIKARTPSTAIFLNASLLLHNRSHLLLNRSLLTQVVQLLLLLPLLIRHPAVTEAEFMLIFKTCFDNKTAEPSEAIKGKLGTLRNTLGTHERSSPRRPSKAKSCYRERERESVCVCMWVCVCVCCVHMYILHNRCGQVVPPVRPC
jgi:hypothetical protein